MTPALTMRLVQRVPRTSELPRSLVGRHLAITRLGLACGSASLGLACGITSLSTHLLVDTLRSHAWDLLVAAPAWDLLVASPAPTHTCWSTLVGRHLVITRLGLACGSASLGLACGITSLNTHLLVETLRSRTHDILYITCLLVLFTCSDTVWLLLSWLATHTYAENLRLKLRAQFDLLYSPSFMERGDPPATLSAQASVWVGPWFQHSPHIGCS